MEEHINNGKKHLQADFENRILLGLSYEYDKALWLVPAKTASLVRKPLFAIRDMFSCLGAWSSEKREISISRNLVYNHPWDAVLDVLRHEMAHQLAVEVMGCKNGYHNHPLFLEACQMLRADPKASGNYPPLQDRVFERKDSEKDAVMIRVKKLLALAESKNPNEAREAMKKAHSLIFKYNLDLVLQKREQNYESIFLGEPKLRHFKEEYLLSSLLNQYYFVQGMWIIAYVVSKKKMGRVLEITGLPHNIRIAAYVYDFINRYIDRSWEAYKKGRPLNRYRKTDFAIGLINGFESTLHENRMNTQESKNNNALMVLEDPSLKDYLDYKYPSTTKINRKSSNVDENIWNAGRSVGKKMVISKGISHRSNKKGILE